MPKVGELVNYVLDDRSPNMGEIRPAIITNVLSDTEVNLHIFADGANDFPGLRRAQDGRELLSFTWRGQVERSDKYAAGTWHPVVVDGESAPAAGKGKK